MSPTKIYTTDEKTTDIIKSNCQQLAATHAFSFQDVCVTEKFYRQMSEIDNALIELEEESAYMPYSPNKSHYRDRYYVTESTDENQQDLSHVGPIELCDDAYHQQIPENIDINPKDSGIQSVDLREFFLTNSLEIILLCQAMQLFNLDSSHSLAVSLLDSRVLRLTANQSVVKKIKQMSSHQYVNQYQTMWRLLEQRLTDIAQCDTKKSFHVVTAQRAHQHALSEFFQQFPSLIPQHVNLFLHNHASSHQQPIEILSSDHSPLSSNSTHSPRVFSSVASSPRSPFARSDQSQANGCVMS